MDWFKLVALPFVIALVPTVVKTFATGLLASFTPYAMLGALAFSTIGSGYAVHKFDSWYYGTEKLAAQNAQYASNAKHLKTILALNDKTDATDDDIEKSNQEILDALMATKVKADKAPLIQVKTVSVPVPASCPDAKPNPVCLSAAGMRKLGKLR